MYDIIGGLELTCLLMIYKTIKAVYVTSVKMLR